MVVNVSNVAIATKVALNYEEIVKNSQRTSKIIPFINKYN